MEIKRKMTIYIVVDNLYDGGAGRVASVLANEFCADNDVTIIVKDSQVKYSLNSKVKVVALDDKSSIWFLKVIFRIKSLAKVIKSERPNVIYSLGYVSKYTTFALMLAGKRKCIDIQSERSAPTVVPSSSFMRFVRNWCYGKADYLVCQTNQAEEYFNERIKTPTVVIPNPITKSLPVWHGMDNNTILAACRLDEQKNLPMLLQAFKLLHDVYPDYRLNIYGDGHLKDALFEMIDELGLKGCAFLFPATSEINKIMADTFMYVSSSDHEGLSNSMLEALAIGVPSVCTDCPIGGASMMIKDKENGLLTPVKDIDSFFRAMEWVIENKEGLNDLSKKAQEVRNDLAPQKIAKKWLEIVYRDGRQ